VSYDVDFQLQGLGQDLGDLVLGPFDATALPEQCLDYEPQVTGLVIAPSVVPSLISSSSSVMSQTTGTGVSGTSTGPAAASSSHSGADGNRVVPVVGCLLAVAVAAVVIG
jgi:hypothetical protein